MQEDIDSASWSMALDAPGATVPKAEAVEEGNREVGQIG